MKNENKKKLKILMFCYNKRNDFENNFEAFLGKIKRDRMAPDFNEIFVFSWSSRSYFLEKGNIKIFCLKFRFKHMRFFYDFLTVFIVPFVLFRYKFRPDVVWVRDFSFVFSGFFPKIFFNSKIALFLGTTPKTLAKTRKLFLPRIIYIKISEFFSKFLVDFFMANGEEVKNYIIDLGVKKNNIQIMVEDVIGKEKERMVGARKGEIRKKFHIDKNKKIILSVARLEPEKGFDRLLKVVKSLKRDDFVLIIAGSGVLEKELKETVDNYEINNKVIFAGWVSRDEIWNYYLDADCFIFLSYSEGNPNVMREAMYMEVPVIGSKIPPVREFIGQDGERGFLWEPEDGIKDLEKKLNLIFTKDEKSLEVIKKAKKYINKNIAVDYIINDYLLNSGKDEIKIKYLSNARIPTEKAHGYQVCKMCEEFSRIGCDVELIFPDRENLIEKDLFDFYGLDKNFKTRKIRNFDFFKWEKFLGGKVSFYAQNIFYLSKLFFLKVKKNNLIFTRNPEIAFIFSIRRFKNCLELHTWPESKNKLFKFLSFKADSIVCITKSLKRKIKEEGFTNKILVAPDGVDLNKFDIEISKKQARGKLNLPQDKNLIIYTGHLYDWKGVDTLAKSAKNLNPDQIIYFVGGTEKDTSDFKNKHKDLINKGKIVIIGQVERAEIPFWLKASDILVLPNSAKQKISSFYTSPLKLFEYMTSGRPVLSSDLKSLREILDESSAVFFEPDNPVDLAKKIKDILADYDKFLKKADKAKKDSQKYDWRQRAKSIIDFIKFDL